MPKRLCKTCGKLIRYEDHLNRSYCSDECRVRFRVNKERNLRRTAATRKEVAQLPDHIKKMVDLAFGANSDEVVRQVFREEVRENVTRYVRDNVLGAAEVLTQMLPKTLEGIARDLDDPDWVVRSKAQALVMKYAMTFAEKEGDKNDLGTLTVVHNVPLPDTPLGQQIAEIADQVDSELEILEDFEKYWPICSVCEKRKHPDVMHNNGGNNQNYICSTCKAYRDIKTGK